jgi:hypothetical protein
MLQLTRSHLYLRNCHIWLFFRELVLIINMKKLLTILLLTLGLIGTSHSNILDNLLGNMSVSDVKLYDVKWTDAGIIGAKDTFDYRSNPGITIRAKIKNLNQEKSIKDVTLKIKTLDCKKGCKDCITVDIGNYGVLGEYTSFNYDKEFTTPFRPNNVNQIEFNFWDDTQKDTYVQARGNVTCFNASVSEVKGFHIFE